MRSGSDFLKNIQETNIFEEKIPVPPSSDTVKEIAQALYKADDVTILIGAGASKSANIPSAKELIDEIRDKHPKIFNRLSQDEQKDYGKVMGKLTQEQAIEILKPHLNQAKINWGYICLAHIFHHLSNLKNDKDNKRFHVLSFNFDNIFHQSLTFLSHTPTIYDCAVAPIQKDHLQNLAPKAIFHLHGQNYGLKLLNSDEETRKHKESLEPLFGELLNNDVILVMGYSGEADPCLELIQKSYKRNTPLFWLGYNENPSETLQKEFPEFRNQNQNNKARYLGGCDFDSTMIAITQEISKLAETAQENFSWPPTLFTNTPDHARTLMNKLAPYPSKGRKENDTSQKLFPLDNFFTERFGEASSDWYKKYKEENDYLDIILKDKEPKEPNKEEDKKLTPWGARLKSYAWLSKAEKLINYLPVSRTRKEDISEIRKSLKNSDIIIGKNALTLSLKYLAFAQDITFKDYLEDFKKAEEKFPTDKDMFNVYGFFLFHYGLHYEKENNEKAIKKYKAACDKFEKSIKLKKEQALIWYVLGNISANIGALTKDSEKLKDACSKYKEATELDNHHPNFWSNWGDTLSQLGDIARDQGNENPHKYYQEACEKYKKSIEFDKNQPNTWLNWGAVLSNMGKITKDIKALSEACNKYKEAIKREQSNITAWGYWGATLSQLGDIAEDSGDIPQAQTYYQDACEKYKKSIELDKNQPEIYNDWGITIFLLGQIEENSDEYGKAQTYYQKAIEIYKNISDKRTEIHKNNLGRTYLRWGVCLLTLGISKANNTPKEDAIQKLTQAIEKFQNAEELSCKETELYNAQGAAYSQLGDIARDKGDEKALEYYKDACKKYKRAEELGCKEPALYQNWGSTLSGLGTIAQSLGKNQESQDYYQKACKKYKRAEELSYKEPSLYLAWGNTLLNLGKIAQGLGNNQEAQDYYKNTCEKYIQAEELGCKEHILYLNWGIILNLLGAQEGKLGKKSEELNYNKQAHDKFKEAISIEQAKENPDQEFIKKLQDAIQELTEIIEGLSSPPNPSS